MPVNEQYFDANTAPLVLQKINRSFNPNSAPENEQYFHANTDASSLYPSQRTPMSPEDLNQSQRTPMSPEDLNNCQRTSINVRGCQ